MIQGEDIADYHSIYTMSPTHIMITNAPQVYFNILAHLIRMHTLTCIREGAMIHMESMSFGPHSIRGQGMQYFWTASRTAVASFSPSSFRSSSSARMHSCPCAVDVQMKWSGYVVPGGSLACERDCIKLITMCTSQQINLICHTLKQTVRNYIS